jgi:hypothetical protein
MFYAILLNVGVMNVLYNFIKYGVMNVLYNFIKCGVYECSMQFY